LTLRSTPNPCRVGSFHPVAAKRRKTDADHGCDEFDVTSVPSRKESVEWQAKAHESDEARVLKQAFGCGWANDYISDFLAAEKFRTTKQVSRRAALKSGSVGVRGSRGHNSLPAFPFAGFAPKSGVFPPTFGRVIRPTQAESIRHWVCNPSFFRINYFFDGNARGSSKPRAFDGRFGCETA